MEEQIISIEQTLYIDKNYIAALNLIKSRFPKHKCNRINNCICINYGKMLIDIYMNNDNLDKMKVTLVQYISEFFISPEINLPYSVFIYLIRALLKLHYFMIAKSLIVNYLLYSNVSEKKDKPYIVSRDEVLYIDLV